MSIQQEGPKNGSMKIRVFYPNPISTTFGSDPIPKRVDMISEEFTISYLERLDPIYHELVFIDIKGIRHQIVGLAYHLTEPMPESLGVDAQV